MVRSLFDKGQSLIEILIAISVGGVLIGAAIGAVTLFLRNSLDVRMSQAASSLAEEYVGGLRSISESNWRSVYDLVGKGPDSQFYLIPSGTSTYIIVSGTTSTIKEGRVFTRYFSIENVNRDSCGVGDITTDAAGPCLGPGTAGVAEDPSTQKITVKIDWEGNQSLSKIQYLGRSRNRVLVQTDWSGGFNQEGPVLEPNNKFATSTNINYTTSTGSIVIQGF